MLTHKGYTGHVESMSRLRSESFPIALSALAGLLCCALLFAFKSDLFRDTLAPFAALFPACGLTGALVGTRIWRTSSRRRPWCTATWAFSFPLFLFVAGFIAISVALSIMSPDRPNTTLAEYFGGMFILFVYYAFSFFIPHLAISVLLALVLYRRASTSDRSDSDHAT